MQALFANLVKDFMVLPLRLRKKLGSADDGRDDADEDVRGGEKGGDNLCFSKKQDLNIRFWQSIYWKSNSTYFSLPSNIQLLLSFSSPKGNDGDDPTPSAMRRRTRPEIAEKERAFLEVRRGERKMFFFFLVGIWERFVG